MNGSATWRSTVKTGLRLVIGSWKMTEIWLPRILYISCMGSVVSSRPSKRMLPLSM